MSKAKLLPPKDWLEKLWDCSLGDLNPMTDDEIENLERENRRAVAEAVQEACAKSVPLTWLDPLLSGPDAINLEEPGSVEELLRRIAARIRALDLTALIEGD